MSTCFVCLGPCIHCVLLYGYSYAGVSISGEKSQAAKRVRPVLDSSTEEERVPESPVGQVRCL